MYFYISNVICGLALLLLGGSVFYHGVKRPLNRYFFIFCLLFSTNSLLIAFRYLAAHNIQIAHFIWWTYSISCAFAYIALNKFVLYFISDDSKIKHNILSIQALFTGFISILLFVTPFEYKLKYKFEFEYLSIKPLPIFDVTYLLIITFSLIFFIAVIYQKIIALKKINDYWNLQHVVQLRNSVIIVFLGIFLDTFQRDVVKYLDLKNLPNSLNLTYLLSIFFFVGPISESIIFNRFLNISPKSSYVRLKYSINFSQALIMIYTVFFITELKIETPLKMILICLLFFINSGSNLLLRIRRSNQDHIDIIKKATNLEEIRSIIQSFFLINLKTDSFYIFLFNKTKNEFIKVAGDSFSQEKTKAFDSFCFYMDNKFHFKNDLTFIKFEKLLLIDGHSPVNYFSPVCLNNELQGVIFCEIKLQKAARLEQLNNFSKELGIVFSRELIKKEALDAQRINDHLITMVQAVSHHIKGPIVEILGQSATLLSKSILELQTDSNYLNKKIGFIYESATNLSTYVKNILMEGNLLSGSFRAKCVQSSIYSICNKIVTSNYWLITNKGICLNILADKNILIQTDPDLVEVVLDNIVKNSVKYSDIKTTILLEINENFNNIEIIISDQGPGLPQKILDSIFHENLDSFIQGTGLKISKKIVTEYLNGKFQLIKTNKEGTTLKFTLPKKWSLIHEA